MYDRKGSRGIPDPRTCGLSQYPPILRVMEERPLKAGRCPHCRSRNIRRRHREHRIYKWRCYGCSTIFRQPRRGIPTWTWIVAAVGVVVILALALWWGLAPRLTNLISEPDPTGVTRIGLPLTMQPTPSAIHDDGLRPGCSHARLGPDKFRLEDGSQSHAPAPDRFAQQPGAKTSYVVWEFVNP